MTAKPHYHVWVRTGKIFSMRERVYESRHTATKAARRLRPDVADRLVLACEDCPRSRPSRRREPRWSVVARAVAQALDAPAAEVRSIVRAAVAADRGGPRGSAPPRRGDDRHVTAYQ